jgi:argininosuccinate synthase
LEFADTHGIPIAMDKRGEAPFSVDANLLHTSSEGKVGVSISIFYTFFIWIIHILYEKDLKTSLKNIQKSIFKLQYNPKNH